MVMARRGLDGLEGDSGSDDRERVSNSCSGGSRDAHGGKGHVTMQRAATTAKVVDGSVRSAYSI